MTMPILFRSMIARSASFLLVASVIFLSSHHLHHAAAQQAESQTPTTANPSPDEEFGPAYSFERQPEYSLRKTPLQHNIAPGEKFAYEFRYETELNQTNLAAMGMIAYRATTEDPASLLEAGHAEKEERTGTAFVVRPDGFLVTCCHCVEGAIKVEVHLDGQTYEAKVVDLDPLHDLALLRIDAKNLPLLPIMDSDQIELAEEVRVVGFPLTDVLGESLKISRGTIAGIHTDEEGKSFQLDALINPGNSGGPVVTEKGHVAGVAKSRLAGDGISSIGLAVTSNEIRQMLARQNLKYRIANEADDYLRGPDLAKQVAPAVALLKVTVSSGGVGFADHRVLSYEASYSALTNASLLEGRRPEAAGVPVSGKTLVNPFGEVNYCSGKFALPSLLGSIGTLGFEVLPRDDVNSWKDDRLLLIPSRQTKSICIDTNALPHVGFRPNRQAPYGFDQNDPRKSIGALLVVPAMEVCDYKIIGTSGNFIEIEKTHHVSAIAKDGEKPEFEVQGSARIRFNTREGRLESIHYRGNADVTYRQVTIHTPIVFTLTRNDDLLQKKPTVSQSASMGSPLFPTPPKISRPSTSTPKVTKPAPVSKPIPKVKGLSKLRLD